MGILFYDYAYIPSGDEVAVGIATIIIAGLAGWAVGAGAGAGALIPVFV